MHSSFLSVKAKQDTKLLTNFNRNIEYKELCVEIWGGICGEYKPWQGTAAGEGGLYIMH